MREFRGTIKLENDFDVETYLHYYARIKFLFNLSHLTPIEEDKRIVSTALKTVTRVIENGTMSIDVDKYDDAVMYFVDTFLPPSGKYCEMDDFLEMKSSLTELLQEIEEHLAHASSSAER